MTSRYPNAQWAPWRYLAADGEPAFYRGENHPTAVVLHVMQGCPRRAIHRDFARPPSSCGHIAGVRFGAARSWCEPCELCVAAQVAAAADTSEVRAGVGAATGDGDDVVGLG